MSPNPRPGGPRHARTALVALALVLLVAASSPWGQPSGPSAATAGDLTAAVGDHPGGEVIVTGEWVATKPTGGYVVVDLRGPDGVRVACHFEDVSADDRCLLEANLNRYTEVVVHGRRGGVVDGVATLRGCNLLD